MSQNYKIIILSIFINILNANLNELEKDVSSFDDKIIRYINNKNGDINYDFLSQEYIRLTSAIKSAFKQMDENASNDLFNLFTRTIDSFHLLKQDEHNQTTRSQPTTPEPITPDSDSIPPNPELIIFDSEACQLTEEIFIETL